MTEPDDALQEARAQVLHDLGTRGLDVAAAVSLLDDAVTARRWWVEQWPAGAEFVTCLVAQDVQEALLDTVGRWPLCTLVHEADDDPDGAHDVAHDVELRVSPDLGPAPHWVCESSGVVVSPVGALPPG